MPGTRDTTDGAAEPDEPRPPLDSKRKGRIAVGLGCVVLGVAYVVEAVDLGVGELREPGPGMFPTAVGVAVVAAGVLTCAEAYLSTAVSGRADLVSSKSAPKVFGLLGAVFLYALALPHLGQYLACPLFMIAAIRLLGTGGWLKSIGYGLAGGLVISMVFVELLAIRMPTGLWAGPFP